MTTLGKTSPKELGKFFYLALGSWLLLPYNEKVNENGEQRLCVFFFFKYVRAPLSCRGPHSQALLAGRREGSAELDCCIVDNIKWHLNKFGKLETPSSCDQSWGNVLSIAEPSARCPGLIHMLWGECLLGKAASGGRFIINYGLHQ